MDTAKNRVAIILCGGQSTRMQNPKSHLVYHFQEQYLHLIQLCVEAGLETYVSCTFDQAYTFKENTKLILDLSLYTNAGPISGLLSAIEKHPTKAILVIGCDYPLFGKFELNQLLDTFELNKQTVCFYNEISQMEEPLLAIYHPNDFSRIKSNFLAGKQSLRNFLAASNPIRIKPKSIDVLKSFDTPEEFSNFTAPPNAL
ncbi:MAG: hypothetical protein CFE21_14115 [Bacteroidetes bacterium B1(2017)]|nr:MAG: hypothetical protein CFE21_14115 [Bacteroidetes bacterium B1(2017)]